MKTSSAQPVAGSLTSSHSLRLKKNLQQTLQEMLKSKANEEECAQDRVSDLGFTRKKVAVVKD